MIAVGALVSCAPADFQAFHAWDQDFVARPKSLDKAVTGLWISSYREDPASGQFVRQTASGQIPEKLDASGDHDFTAAVPVLVQTETSDGPQPDRWDTILIHVVKTGDHFTLSPNDALPGEIVGWHDEAHRTLAFRGRTAPTGPQRTLWQFQGRY